MDPLTPIRDPVVAEAVARCYAVFSSYTVSRQLEVCHCDCCMTEEVRQEIITTPVPDLSRALVTEYTNSAHGVPHQTDDMKALLPRYLELIAQDEEPDYSGVGTVLLRYGQALAADPELYSAGERAALDAWARAMVPAVVRAEGLGADVTLGQCHLIEVLLVGGWSASLLTGAFDAALDAPHGPVALSLLARQLLWANRNRHDGFFDLFALRYASDAARAGLSDWLAAPAFRERLEAAILGAPENGVDDPVCELASRLHTVLALQPRPHFRTVDRG